MAFPPYPGEVEFDYQYYRGLLEARKTELLGLIDASAASAAPVELDQQLQGRLSRMDAMQGQAMAKATNQRRRAGIAQLDAAIKRIDENEFGYCQTCGEQIAVKRLEINPAAALCFDCAK